ncbi:MAG: NusG domain II-containing protein [Chitinispirillales bacterium]|jgi:hypothetical protein|nr:NusG domain II-containing protein [Chitinispirillales bacterium]
MAQLSNTIRTFGIADVFIVLIMMAGLISVFALFKSGLPDRVVVFKDNSLMAEYPLDDNIIFTVNGKNGPVIIEIKDRETKIKHVNCPHQICKRTGGISRTFGQLVCAPNNILVEIRSTKTTKSVDGVTY